MKTGVEIFLDYYKERFAKGEVTEEQLSQMVSKGALDEDEKAYIMGGGSGELEGLRTFHSEVMGLIGGE